MLSSLPWFRRLSKRPPTFLPTCVIMVAIVLWIGPMTQRMLKEQIVEDMSGKVNNANFAPKQPRVTALQLELPERMCAPTRDKPFVFFHQRKTAGSSLRKQIWSSCRARNWTCQVPCMSHECRAVVSRSWDYEVLAGHFTWSYVFSEEPLDVRFEKLSCLTVFRNPFERVRSSYYYANLGSLIKWDKRTPEMMHRVLTNTSVGRLCVNEPIRLFSGIGSNRVIANLYQNPTIRKEAVQLTIDNMSKCVVLMMEDFHKPVTVAILRHWFPWLNYTKEKVNVNAAKPKTEEPLSPEVNATLTAILAPEIALYNAALHQYHRQLQYMASWPRVEPCPMEEHEELKRNH